MAGRKIKITNTSYKYVKTTSKQGRVPKVKKKR